MLIWSNFKTKYDLTKYSYILSCNKPIYDSFSRWVCCNLEVKSAYCDLVLCWYLIKITYSNQDGVIRFVIYSTFLQVALWSKFKEKLLYLSCQNTKLTSKCTKTNE